MHIDEHKLHLSIMQPIVQVQIIHLLNLQSTVPLTHGSLGVCVQIAESQEIQESQELQELHWNIVKIQITAYTKRVLPTQ